jgi:hypothetical protein
LKEPKAARRKPGGFFHARRLQDRAFSVQNSARTLHLHALVNIA